MSPAAQSNAAHTGFHSDAHTVLRLWTRPVAGGPLAPQESLELVAGKGIRGDHGFGGRRHVTVVFADDWRAATEALGRDVDPVGRRANVLVSGGGGAAFLGQSIRLGNCTLEVHAETRPCDVMDQAAPGLMEALKPDVRAGFWATVVTGGRLRPGDVLSSTITPQPSSSTSFAIL
jgi:MOSC domain-containing protein YiiM